MLFGSALKNFGVRDLIETPGGARAAAAAAAGGPARRRCRTSRQMTGFVFKIQANMDPNHRDRIAFLRVCSGKLPRGMKVKLVRTGKSMTLATPQFFFAQDRALADEAFAGDIVGIPNHGTLADRRHPDRGRDARFRGVPNFAPEILRRVRVEDAMKAKKLSEALQQIAEEGVVQLFLPIDGSPADRRRRRCAAARRADRALEGRIRSADDLRNVTFPARRWIEADKPGDLVVSSRQIVAHGRDLDGAPVFMAPSAFQLNYEQDRWKAVRFSDVKDYQRVLQVA